MILRSVYVEDSSNLFDDYYGQFVDDYIISLVKNRFKNRIHESDDKHFNDIPLASWDGLANSINGYSPLLAKCKAAGDNRSLSFFVCVLKAAAKKIKNQNKVDIV